MRVLVTGGAGYIGSHTTRALKRRGHQVVVYDNLSTGHVALASGFELVRGDIRDRATLRRALQDMEAVIHFAAHAYVGESVNNPRIYYENNVCGSLELLGAMVDAGIDKLVFSSSCAVYGIPDAIPICEDTLRLPVNPYGATKLAIEQALDAYSVAYRLRSVSLRYFNAAGADEDGAIGELHHPETHLIPLALGTLLGGSDALSVFGDDYPTQDGTCVRDYIHVDDLALAHVCALDYLAGGGKTRCLNLGTGRGHSIGEVLGLVQEITGRPVPYRVAPRRPGDPPILVADSSLASAVLGWRASRTLRDCIRTAWRWMQQQPGHSPIHEME